MFSATVRLIQMGATLVCSHIPEQGAHATAGITLRRAGYVRLCADCDKLAHAPGALKFKLPGERREKPLPHRHEHIDRYIAEHVG